MLFLKPLLIILTTSLFNISLKQTSYGIAAGPAAKFIVERSGCLECDIFGKTITLNDQKKLFFISIIII